MLKGFTLPPAPFPASGASWRGSARGGCPGSRGGSRSARVALRGRRASGCRGKEPTAGFTAGTVPAARADSGRSYFNGDGKTPAAARGDNSRDGSQKSGGGGVGFTEGN